MSFFVFKTGSSCFRTIRIYKPDQLFGKMNLPFNWSTCKFPRLNQYISYKINGCLVDNYVSWVCYWFRVPCSERFFLGYPGFPLSSKTNTSKFQFDLESMDVTRLNLFIRTPKCFLGKQIIVKRSKYFPLNDCDHLIYSTFFVSMYWYCLEKFDVVHPWDLKGEPFLFVRLKYFT